MRSGRRIRRLGVLLLSSLGILNCSKSAPAEDRSAPEKPPVDSVSALTDLPSPYKAPAAYADIIRDYRKKWTRVSGFDLSGLHWNQYVTIYMNKEPEKYLQNFLEYVRIYVDADEEEADTANTAFQAYDAGTIFLKENYLLENGKPGRPLTITMMIKKEKGYDPGSGDWQFVQFDVNGNILNDGNSQNPVTQASCVKCHANMAERDYVFSTFCSLVPASK